MRYNVSCHCGEVAYSVEGELEQAIECNCTHCSRKGYLLWFVPSSQVTFKTPEDAPPDYQFNRRAIHHRFCPTCGCAPFANGKDAKGNDTVAVNVRCIEGIDLATVKRVPFDGLHK
jgi:hypothetical protein